MKKGPKIHFLAGMPRAGNALLASILAQNPRFEIGNPGGILDAVYFIGKSWGSLVQFVTSPNEIAKTHVLRAMLNGFHSRTARPITFDRSTAVLAHLETVEILLDRPAKVIVPVRDMAEILASYERAWRRNDPTGETPIEAQFYPDFQSAQGRCSVWLRPENPIGLAYSRIEDAIRRGHRKKILFVRYEQLTTRPKQVLSEIYEFLDEPGFDHKFHELAQVTPHDDPIYGFRDCHNIRARLEPTSHQAHITLGESAEQYAGPFVWDL